MSPTLRRLLLAALTTLSLLAVSAAPAAAGPQLESIFQDDAVLLNSGPEATGESLDEMRALGATTIHSLMVWAQVAPQREAVRKPTGFVGDDPRDYPVGAWDRFDNLVREASARRMSVIFTLTTPAPAWAGDCETTERRQSCVNRPSPAEFRRFVSAVATRYRGNYDDPRDDEGVLPRVSRWSFINEPNLGSWLTPQFVREDGDVVPTGVHIYRRLVDAGIDGMRANGHAGSALYLGETAPVGGGGSSLAVRRNAPRTFLQGVLCLNSRGRPLRDARIGCGRRFSQLRVSGFTHHPYTLGAGAPPYARSGADDITLGYLGRLTSVVSQAVKQGRVPRSAAGRIYFTEFGYQTNPPDSRFGVSWERQAEYINLGDFLGYRMPGVRGVAQYELYDELSTDSFNTGLRTCRPGNTPERQGCTGTRKEAYNAYRLPLYVTRAGKGNIRVFGWVRPARGAQRVELRLITGSGDNRRVRVLGTFTTNDRGILDRRMTRRIGEYQLRWNDGTRDHFSRKARIALR